MVGAAILALLLWLTGSGVGALLGTLGGNIGDITDIAQQEGTTTAEAQQQAEQELNQIDRDEAFNNVRDSAWGTLAGMILPLAAFGLGGLTGQNRREDVIQRASTSGAI